MTREQWLQDCAALLARDRFTPAFYTVPAVHISVGFPSRSALANRSRRIGECWSNTATADGLCQVFVSPVLSNPVEVIATLAHELVHATVGLQAKHGPAFKRCATAIGLTGKMTATVAADSLKAWITATALPALGAYPHPAFDPKTAQRIKGGTRLLKCECPSCGCTIRITRKWLDAVGAPICSCPDGPQMTVV